MRASLSERYVFLAGRKGILISCSSEKPPAHSIGISFAERVATLVRPYGEVWPQH